MNTERMQVHNRYDTKFKIQGAMKVDLPDPAALARQGKELLREAQILAAANQQHVDPLSAGSAEQEMLYNSRIAALSTLATAHFAAAQYYWEDR